MIRERTPEGVQHKWEDEFLNIELFTSLQRAELLSAQSRIEYNVYIPLSALHGRKPMEVLQQ